MIIQQNPLIWEQEHFHPLLFHLKSHYIAVILCNAMCMVYFPAVFVIFYLLDLSRQIHETDKYKFNMQLQKLTQTINQAGNTLTICSFIGASIISGIGWGYIRAQSLQLQSEITFHKIKLTSIHSLQAKTIAEIKYFSQKKKEIPNFPVFAFFLYL